MAQPKPPGKRDDESEPEAKGPSPRDLGSGSASSTPVQPQFIEHYRIEAVIARGGFGTVCRAIDTTLDRTVALKLIDDPERAPSLIAEAKNTSRLSHPRIAQVYQAGIDEKTGLAFIAFEWVDGPTLRALLRSGELPISRVLRLGQDIATAVAHAHDNDLIHGDLKADNIVVTGEPVRAKLLDFGLSIAEEILGEGEMWGTPAYMAPELLAGGPRTMETDHFALGVILFELATGQLPFGGEDGDEHSVREHQKEPAPDPRESRPDLPSEIADRVRILLSLDPAKRSCDAVELQRVIQLRRRADHGRRMRLPPLLLILAVLLGAWIYRDDLWTGGGNGSGGGSQDAAPPPPYLSVGTWTGPTGDENDASRTIRDLLTLHLAGADPGSALLVPGQAPFASGTVTQTSGEGGSGEWTARWQGTDVEGDPDASLEESALGALPLARQVAARVRVRSSNPEPTTLDVTEEALLLFCEGVRATDSGNWTEARQRLSLARTRAGAFPEAAAWEAALWVIADRPTDALTLLEPLGDATSAPASILRAVLEVPVRDRSLRWNQPHRLAMVVDLVLDLHDPSSVDGELLGRLEEESTEAPRAAGLDWWARESAFLSWRTGDLERLAAAIERYRVQLGPVRTAELWRLEHALRLALGPRDEAMELFQDQLFELPANHPAGWLKIPFLVQKNRFDPAAGAAESRESSTESALAQALSLAIAGRPEQAIEKSRAIVDRFDPSLSHRVRAAIEILRGDPDAALRALREAEQLDPGRPEIEILRNVVTTEPLTDLPVTLMSTGGSMPGGANGSAVTPENPASTSGEVATFESDSRVARFEGAFRTLAGARRSRIAGDPASAADSLAPLRFVADDLSLYLWPEAIFFARLERIVALADAGDRAAARREWKSFRKLWPAERAPSSRVAQFAREVESALKGDDTAEE